MRPNHSRDTQRLQGTDNQTTRKSSNDICASSRDILEIFPPEVWIQIVEDALPVHGYCVALLLMTMVSNKWMRSLISIPTLWAQIDVLGSQEDSLASIEAFRRLSCEAPLHLSVYVPTLHDLSVIEAILTSIGPRLYAVTIKHRSQHDFLDEEWAVLELLLTGSRFNSGLAYINLEYRSVIPRDNTAIIPLVQNNSLPPSLRAIRGWNFQWRVFQTEHRYLERVEAIDSRYRVEGVLSRHIQLPNLRSLILSGDMSPRSEFRSEGGLPLLGKLTSLTYTGSSCEDVIPLLLSVAPQLVYLYLRIPRIKIPLLGAGLQAAINLQELTIHVIDHAGDEGVNRLDVPPIHQHIAGHSYGLRGLRLIVFPDTDTNTDQQTPKQPRRTNPFLSFIMSTISVLYISVETLVISILTEYPVTFVDVLLYLQSLPYLRVLRLRLLPEHFQEIRDTCTLRRLEYLNTVETDSSYCLQTPNLLSLKFTWGCYRHLDNLIYINLRKLFVEHNGNGPPIVELQESSFPSLRELTLSFYSPEDSITYSSFTLPSFQLLSSITIGSGRYQPQGTMLCFAILNHPSTCPALHEIRFPSCFPDWDILFIMLEKRNFMGDSAVSLIRQITLPYIPNELRTPLASLLGGVYATRPPNEELFMGGAQELLLDEQVSVGQHSYRLAANASQVRMY